MEEKCDKQRVSVCVHACGEKLTFGKMLLEQAHKVPVRKNTNAACNEESCNKKNCGIDSLT